MLEKREKRNNGRAIKTLIIIFIFISIIIFQVYRKANTENEINLNFLNKETIVEDKDYLYETAVEFIKDKYHDLNTRKEQDDYQVLVSYKSFGITKDKNYYYAYMWVLSESYYTKENKLYNGRTNSSLYKITYKDNKVISYDMPGGDEDFEDSENYFMSKDDLFDIELKEICPNKKIYNLIINYEFDLSNDSQIKECYNYLEDFTTIKEGLGEGSSYDSNRKNNYSSSSNSNRKSSSASKRRRHRR